MAVSSAPYHEIHALERMDSAALHAVALRYALEPKRGDEYMTGGSIELFRSRIRYELCCLLMTDAAITNTAYARWEKERRRQEQIFAQDHQRALAGRFDNTQMGGLGQNDSLSLARQVMKQARASGLGAYQTGYPPQVLRQEPPKATIPTQAIEKPTGVQAFEGGFHVVIEGEPVYRTDDETDAKLMAERLGASSAGISGNVTPPVPEIALDYNLHNQFQPSATQQGYLAEGARGVVLVKFSDGRQMNVTRSNPHF